MCVDEIHSDGLSSDLQESLDHLLYHPNIFWLNMIMLNKGLRCHGFCSPILLLLPLLKQFGGMARLKHLLFRHVKIIPHMCDG